MRTAQLKLTGVLQILLFIPSANAERWPVTAPRITQDYACYGCYVEGKHHTGIDLTEAFNINSCGTSVRAFSSGVVYRTLSGCNNFNQDCGGGYGNHIVIWNNEPSNPLYFLYAHLSNYSIIVSSGQVIQEGDHIADMGSTGFSTGCHLHLAAFTIDPGNQGDFPNGVFPPPQEVSGIDAYTTEYPNMRNFVDPKSFLTSIPVRVESPEGIAVLERPMTGTLSVTDIQQDQEYFAIAKSRRIPSLQDWYYIFLPSTHGPRVGASSVDSTYGWVPDSHDPVSGVTTRSFPLELTVRGNTIPSGSGIPIYSGPGESYKKITRVWEEQRLAALSVKASGDGCSGPWLKISVPIQRSSTGATAGWICSNDVSFLACLNPTGNVSVMKAGSCDHTLTITVPAFGSPNPVNSGGNVTLSVVAEDSFGDTLSYSWTSICSNLSTNGFFSNARLRSPRWTAPVNTTGRSELCLVEVTVSDGQGLSDVSTFLQEVLSIGHTIDIISEPEGIPNPVAPRGFVDLTVLSNDSLDHSLSYAWTATCPGLPNNGSFSGSATRTPRWLAPVNNSPNEVDCIIEVTISDGLGLSVPDSYTQTVNPGGVAALSVSAGLSMSPSPFASSSQPRLTGQIKNVSCNTTCATVVLDRLQGIATFVDPFGHQHTRDTMADNLSPTLTLAPGETYSFDMMFSSTLGGDSTLGYTGSAALYVKFDNTPGQEPVTQAESGATAQFSFTMNPHTITFTNDPGSSSNPVSSGGSARMLMNSIDSFRHETSYRWSATCPTLPTNGNFDDPFHWKPNWIAPLNTTGADQVCTITIVVSDTFGESAHSSFEQVVQSVPHVLTTTLDAQGSPNPVSATETAALRVTATDSLGHPISYAWSALCPELDGNGTFSNTGIRTPLWTAPDNTTGTLSECTIEVVVGDGHGLTSTSSYTQSVFYRVPLCVGNDATGDTDEDGVCDDTDGCPVDPNKTAPGVCGCGNPDIDTDSDEVLDCLDICAGFNDNADDDGDGVPDGCDLCVGNDAIGDIDGDLLCADLDCDDEDATAQLPDDCGVCGGDNASCPIFEDGFESGDMSAWTGNVGQSIDLERDSGQYFLISDANQSGLDVTGDMTIEAWVKVESVPSSHEWFYTIASKIRWITGRSDNAMSYQFVYDNWGNNGTRLVFSHDTAPSGQGTFKHANLHHGLTVNEWHHVAVVYTASQASVTFYVDGSAVGTLGGLNTSTLDTTADFLVGARNDEGIGRLNRRVANVERCTNSPRNR